VNVQTAMTVALIASLVTGSAGVACAWWLRRRTTISIRNLYLLAVVLLIVNMAAAAVDLWALLIVLGPALVFAAAGSLVGRRWRLSDLGAGEDLRQHELARRWIWQPTLERRPGERVMIATQGEIVRTRPWPADLPFVPMTRDENGARLPRKAGQHVFTVGATGSGKTWSVLRAAIGRALADNTALLWVDPKGDEPTLRMLKTLARLTGRPFILFDPRDPSSDRWQALWGDRPSSLVSRLLRGIQTSEPYYADLLRQHVTIVARVLISSGYSPPSFPFLASAAQLHRWPRIMALAEQIQDDNPDLWQRVSDHAEFVRSRESGDLKGGLRRLDGVVGDAWRPVMTPRKVSRRRVPAGVALPEAIKAGAIVLWRTYADDMQEEAAAVTGIALGDIYSAAEAADGAPWTLVLDEFAKVIEQCANGALSVLQRGRSHSGQVFVITQSVADVEAVTGQDGLLDSLTDNFAGFLAHEQTSPDSRDWLAKLMGTTALWQSTDRTSGHGITTTGDGSRRRVREFRISPDTFADLGQGEAVIYNKHQPPTRTKIAACILRPPADAVLPRIGKARHDVEIDVDPTTALPEGAAAKTAPTKRRGSPKTPLPPVAARELAPNGPPPAFTPDDL
jgi:TraM recognition site of TraD and TraG